MKQEAISILKQRILADAIERIDKSRAMEFCKTQNADGSWDDVDDSSQSWANWPMRIHFIRVKEMAAAYANQAGGQYHAEALKTAVCRGVDFWMSREWSNPNWWNMQILQQQEMRYVALLMEDVLGEERIDYIIGILQDFIEESWTGANRVWFAENLMFKGILTQDEQLIRYAVRAIMSTAKREWDEESAPEDGIQPDGCFTQHGVLLYNNGYGAAWLDSVSFWIYQLRGLPFGADRAVYETATSALLDGTAWMQRGGVIDPGTCGREISRKRLGADPRIAKAAQRLLETARAEGFPRAEELDALVRSFGGEEAALPEGNKMFWRVDYMSHRRDAFTATVKMLSRGVKGSESILNENKLGGFLSYGMTVFMRHGREFFGDGCEDGIFPMMDWTHIPGVTAPAIEVSPTETNEMETAFVGGVSDGHCGAAAMEYEKTLRYADGELTFGGKKAYFFFDQGVVVLGCDLHCDSAEASLDTTLNQCRFAGVSWSDGQSAEAVETHRTGSWVNHDSIGYLFFEPTEYWLEQGTCIGGWERISDSYPEERGVCRSRDVFKLYMRHGVRAEDKTCAYIVLPGQSETETAVAAANPPAEVLANDSALQAVYVAEESTAYLIFYEAGSCSIHETLSVTVTDRCMLMLKEAEDGLNLYASNPETQGLKLHISLTYHEKRMDGEVTFPNGESFLGKTQEVLLHV